MSEWKETKIIDIADLNINSINKNSKLNVIEYIDTSSVEQGQLINVQKINLKEAPSRAKRRIQENDILISSVRPNLKHYYFVRQCKENTVVSTGFVVITPKKIVHPYFLYCLLTTNEYTQYLTQIANNHTSTYPSFNPDIIANSVLPIPEFKEQKQIADIISCLDNKIDNLRHQNETLETIAQTLFKHWFIDFEFPKDDGKPYKSSGGAMVASELGDIPEGWRVGKLENFCTVFRGSSPRPISSPVFFKNGNIPWIKIADATRSNSIYLSETREHCTEAALPYTRLLKKGSLILSNSATIGVPMILNLEGCIHDGWLSFKDYKLITRNFLFFILVNKLSFLIQYADGSVQKNLNIGILNNMDFILPNLKIINKFTNFSQSIFDKILSNEKQIQTLTKTRDTLLPKLMSGQIRVKD